MVMRTGLRSLSVTLVNRVGYELGCTTSISNERNGANKKKESEE